MSRILTKGLKKDLVTEFRSWFVQRRLSRVSPSNLLTYVDLTFFGELGECRPSTFVGQSDDTSTFTFVFTIELFRYSLQAK